MGFGYLDIIIFAAVAAFFVFRLRNVLGKRTGHEEKPGFDPFKSRSERDEEGKVIPMPDRKRGRRDDEDDDERLSDHDVFEEFAEDGERSESNVSAGLAQIQRADGSFDKDQFLGGARGAFEMILAAFADGDSKTLRPLLANDVYDNFRWRHQ